MKAFPNPHRTDETGMTLRDYFAAKAMELQLWHNEDDSYSNHADRCYLMADAMLKAREL